MLTKGIFELDPWQEEVLNTKGHICLCSGRQVGKSTVISIKAGDYALKHPKRSILVIAATERQAYLLFEKIISYIHQVARKEIKMGLDRPTKTRLKLKNGSIIYCLPTGDTGYGIRGFTVHQLYADEAHFIKDEVWDAVTPMLATTGGDIILLSTPRGRQGYFFERSRDDEFTQFRVSSEDCPRMDKKHLEQRKAEMSSISYAQEYLGQFVDGLGNFFSDDLINSQLTVDRPEIINPRRDYYLGVDIARMGEDESTFEVIDGTNKQQLVHVESIITRKTLTTASTREILRLEAQYHFKQIFVDAGGLGMGVLDQLLEHPDTKRKTIAIDNVSNLLTYKYADKKKQRKIRIEDLYNNLLGLMERKQITILDDPEIKDSLRSIQYEYVNGKLMIFGRYKHIADGLVRAAYSSKDKSLKVWIDYI